MRHLGALHFLNALALSQPDGRNNALVSFVILSHYGNSVTVYDEQDGWAWAQLERVSGRSCG